MDTIRYQEKEIKKYQAILNILMTQDQQETVLKNADWSESKREWYIPHFTYREKMVNFPKMGGMNREMVEQERDKKEIIFKNSRENSDKGGRSMEGFKMNSIVQQAREGGNDLASATSGPYLRGKHNQQLGSLSPLLRKETFDNPKTEAG